MTLEEYTEALGELPNNGLMFIDPAIVNANVARELYEAKARIGRLERLRASDADRIETLEWAVNELRKRLPGEK